MLIYPKKSEKKKKNDFHTKTMNIIQWYLQPLIEILSRQVQFPIYHSNHVKM